jgi:hypothetical protein
MQIWWQSTTYSICYFTVGILQSGISSHCSPLNSSLFFFNFELTASLLFLLIEKSLFLFGNGEMDE